MIEIDPHLCTACGACEVACSLYREEEVFTTMRSSIILHREERKNYYGVMLKRAGEVLLGRPEGVEVMKEGESSDTGGGGKPILLREPCDNCTNAMCVRFCPTGCLKEV
jgi:Fe-S-cluster-containing dehydrogenase component